MKVQLEKNGALKEVPVGFSWTVFFFGFLVPLLRGDFKWAIIMLIAAPFTLGISSLVFCFIYNKLYIKDLISDGWNPVGDGVRSLLIENKIINQ